MWNSSSSASARSSRIRACTSTRTKLASSFLTLYVDNILFLSTSKTLLSKLKTKLMGRFEMSDIADVSRILTMSIVRDHEKWAITISEKDHTGGVVQRYGMED